MSKKPKIEQPPVAPSLDQMTLKDLASLFALSGLLSHTRALNADPAWTAEKADQFAEAWVKRRTG